MYKNCTSVIINTKSPEIFDPYILLEEYTYKNSERSFPTEEMTLAG